MFSFRFSFFLFPPSHLWGCCGATLAPGRGRRCRVRGATSPGPCTQWSRSPGGRWAGGLWGFWSLRRDQSRTWAAPSRPAASQSRTGETHITTQIGFEAARPDSAGRRRRKTLKVHWELAWKTRRLFVRWALLKRQSTTVWKKHTLHGKSSLSLLLLDGNIQSKLQSKDSRMGGGRKKRCQRSCNRQRCTAVDLNWKQTSTWRHLLFKQTRVLFHLSEPVDAFISHSLSPPPPPPRFLPLQPENLLEPASA